MFWYVCSSIIFGLGGFALFFYYYRKGQFDDVEDIKYQMFREDNSRKKD